MSTKISAYTIAKDYEEQLEKKGFFVCEHCNGTGINPEYQKHNEMVRVLDGADAFFCLFCYGKKQIDWVEYMMGNFDQDIRNRMEDIDMQFFYSIYSYVLYLIHGQNRFDKQLNIWMHYNPGSRCWQKSTRAVGSVKGKLLANELMRKAIYEGYTDDYRHWKFLEHKYEELRINVVEIIKSIKAELIKSTNMTLARLAQIMEELELIGITIGDLERFSTEEGIEKKLPVGFKFNWEDILQKYNLSKAYLHILRRLSNKQSVLRFILPDDCIQF